MSGLWRMARAGAAVACALLAVGLAGLIAAALLSSAWRKLDVFTHFAPMAAAAALAVGVGAYWLGLRRLVLMLAAFAFLGSTALMAPEFAAVGHAAPARVAGEAPRLKVLTMNLWSRNADIRRVEAFVRRERPDIIMLQEAGRDWRPLLQRLADEYGAEAHCARARWCSTVVLSRFAMVEEISPTEVYSMAAARVALPEALGGGVMDVVGVHMPWPVPPWRQEDEFPLLAELSHRLDPSRAIIAGDFNSTPWSGNLRRLDSEIPIPRRTRALFSWPAPGRPFTRFELRAPFPIMPIDHVYAGADWRLVELRRGPSIGSDHYPVIAVFAPQPRPSLRPPPALRGFSRVETAARP